MEKEKGKKYKMNTQDITKKKKKEKKKISKKKKSNERKRQKKWIMDNENA